jgi:excisionase family DNA binding protein
MASLALDHGALLTVDEAAQIIRHRPSTVRAWILKKKIPYIKLARRVFIRRSDIEALIQASVVPATTTVKKENL